MASNHSNNSNHNNHYIYILSNPLFEHKNHYKIGYTDRPHKRINDSSYTTVFVEPCQYKIIYRFTDSKKKNIRVEEHLHYHIQQITINNIQIKHLYDPIRNKCREMYEGELGYIDSIIRDFFNKKSIQYDIVNLNDILDIKHSPEIKTHQKDEIQNICDEVSPIEYSESYKYLCNRIREIGYSYVVNNEAHLYNILKASKCKFLTKKMSDSDRIIVEKFNSCYKSIQSSKLKPVNNDPNAKTDDKSYIRSNNEPNIMMSDIISIHVFVEMADIAIINDYFRANKIIHIDKSN